MSTEYAPLPQTNTDSEDSSEEEIHNIKHTVTRRLQAEKPAINGQTSVQYQPVREANITLNGLDANVIITNSNRHIFSDFSRARLLCLMLSILVCIVTVTTFLLLPCDLLTCPCNTPHLEGSWENTLLAVEPKGPIDIVPAHTGRTNNIILLSRHSSITGSGPYKGRMYCLLGQGLGVMSYIELWREPDDVDCNLLDADNDGVKDCILMGKKGLLRLIHPIYCKLLWNLSNEEFIEEMDFPLVIPDVDGDTVPDLLFSCKLVPNHHYNTLIMVSGQSGLVIGQPLEILGCDSVRNLVMMTMNGLVLSYTCVYSKLESAKTITFQELHTRIRNESLFTEILDLSKPMKQHEPRDFATGETESFRLNNGRRRLLVENHGDCPRQSNCFVTLSVTDERRNVTVWSYKRDNTYAMLPVTFTFDNTVSGFVIKLWEWQFERDKRSISEMGNFTKAVKERIVILPFNDSEGVKTARDGFNISQTDILLLCTGDGVDFCEPDMYNQKHSLMIADLNHDGLQELISYSSTYILNETSVATPGPLRYELRSPVRVVQLESELTRYLEKSSASSYL